MGISAVWSIQLDPILPTTQNKCGLLVLFRTGVQSTQSVIFTAQAYVLVYCDVDVMPGPVTWTTSLLISERMRKPTSFSDFLTLVLSGMSMAFSQMLWYVRHHHRLVLK